jgi:streptogramin lyase
MKKLTLLAFSLLTAPALAQSSYWIANRASSDIMRVSEWGSVLERVATPTTLRGCTTAPDGKVWVVRFGAATFDIYDPATATFTPVLLPSGSAYAITFDAAGHGWVTNAGTAVHEYDAAGTFVASYALTAGAALGITVDASGNKWIAHRASPASVSRIDPSGTVTNFPIVGAPAALLPTGLIADYRGLLTASHIWVTGDSSATLCELDATGATLAVYPGMPTSTAYPPTFDLAGRIWVSSFGNGTVVQIDQATGLVLQTLTFAPNNISVTTDNLGRIRLTSRVTFSGVGPPCEVRRVNATTGALEIPTKLQLGAFSAAGTQWQLNHAEFQYCLVVNPLGDLDGDGDANFTEVTNGTSPIDARSNSLFSVESYGVTVNGGTPTFEVKSTALWIVAFALSTHSTDARSGFGGVLQVNPGSWSRRTPASATARCPSRFHRILRSPVFEFFAQGVTFNGVGFDSRTSRACWSGDSARAVAGLEPRRARPLLALRPGFGRFDALQRGAQPVAHRDDAAILVAHVIRFAGPARLARETLDELRRRRSTLSRGSSSLREQELRGSVPRSPCLRARRCSLLASIARSSWPMRSGGT